MTSTSLLVSCPPDDLQSLHGAEGKVKAARSFHVIQESAWDHYDQSSRVLLNTASHLDIRSPAYFYHETFSLALIE